MNRILVIFGTRPEAIKLAPVINALSEAYSIRVCNTGQHREMIHQALKALDIVPDSDLAIMAANQDLVDVSAKVLDGIKNEIRKFEPDMLLVQGDTTSAMAAALAGFYMRVTIGHIEARLRTASVAVPFPEELNRRLISQMASHHFAPTERARQNLLEEGVASEVITVTGNTVIDALLQNIDAARSQRFSPLLRKKMPFLSEDTKAAKKIILVTLHRRENFGAGVQDICDALSVIARKNPEVQIVFPIHRNPNVLQPVEKMLTGISNITLLEPLDYFQFIKLLDLSYLVLTDSGGVQEEAPSLGKPVLIMREETERSEGVDAGTAKIVGASAYSISSQTQALLENYAEYQKMAHCHSPYGDGRAATRILDTLRGSIK